jgi:xeroderma pigmentosum group C-complementing protein
LLIYDHRLFKLKLGPEQTSHNSNKGKALVVVEKERLKSELPVKTSPRKSREDIMPRPSTSHTKDSKSQTKNSDQPNDLRKRSRRKSAEKPVKYEESPLDDTEEEDVSLRKTPVNSKRTSTNEKLGKSKKSVFKKPKPKITSKRSQESSSDEYEEPSSDDSEIPEKNKISIKKENQAQKESRKIISTDSEGDALAKKKRNTDVWMEVYLEQEEQWMSVDVISGQIHCDRQLERNASDPLLYAVAYNFDLTWKDVTARYASSFLSTTRKQRAHPTWTKILNIHREKPSPRSKAEDESMNKSLTDRPMPTSISEFKSHPLYALQRHLLKVAHIFM